MFVVVVVLWRCVRVLGGLSTATTKETFPLSEASALTPPLRGRAASWSCDLRDLCTPGTTRGTVVESLSP